MGRIEIVALNDPKLRCPRGRDTWQIEMKESTYPSTVGHPVLIVDTFSQPVCAKVEKLKPILQLKS